MTILTTPCWRHLVVTDSLCRQQVREARGVGEVATDRQMVHQLPEVQVRGGFEQVRRPHEIARAVPRGALLRPEIPTLGGGGL